jgi:FPC/CPF motif-containing protein YcgG
VTRLVGELQD